MSKILPTAKREYGHVQPGIKFGMFTIRIPFIHVPWEWAETIQAMVVFVVGISATDLLMRYFEIPFETALAMVCFAEFCLFLQNFLGEPMSGGWITPALPLVIAWLEKDFGSAQERAYAMISLQFFLGSLYLILGFSGLGAKLVDAVPPSVKAGLLLSGAIAGVLGSYGFGSKTEGFYAYPVTFTIGVLIAFFLLFSNGFTQIKQNHKRGLVAILAKAGFVPAILICFVVGVLIGEVPVPKMDFSQGLIFNPFPGIAYSATHIGMFGLGIPPVEILLKALPVAILVYIISFGNIIVGLEFLKDAQEARPDEKIEINANRVNATCGIRNLLLCTFCPFIVMAGPVWAAMTVTIAQRFKAGKEGMYSIMGGALTFTASNFMLGLMFPLVSFTKPILPLAMSLTLMIQAFASFFIALTMCKTNAQRGVAGIVGTIIVATDITTGLIAALVISVIVEYLFVKREKPTDVQPEIKPEMKTEEK